MKKLILIGLVFCSCTRTIYTPVISSHTLIDTLVQTVQDSSVLRALLECDSAGQVVLKELHQTKGKMAADALTISGGKIEYRTAWQTKIIERMIEKTDTITVVKEIEIIKTVKHIPRFFWYCFAVTLAIVGYYGFKIFKRFL